METSDEKPEEVSKFADVDDIDVKALKHYQTRGYTNVRKGYAKSMAHRVIRRISRIISRQVQ